jgi:hypothetical protein
MHSERKPHRKLHHGFTGVAAEAAPPICALASNVAHTVRLPAGPCCRRGPELQRPRRTAQLQNAMASPMQD